MALYTTSSCSDKDLELLPPNADYAANIDNENKLQQILNGAYLSMASYNAYGAELMVFGDILADKIYNSPSRALFIQTYEYNYNATQNQFGFYGTLYSAIVSSNIVINNKLVDESAETTRMKGEAKILRALAYFTLVNYYSPTPTSGVNQEYGVPLVLEDYDVTIQPARATVAENYEQIIKDLQEGIIQTNGTGSKITLGPNVAKLLLSKVYLTRRATGDAQLALQYANEVIATAPATAFTPSSTFTLADYTNYWKGNSDDEYENHPETLWELDLNQLGNAVLGIGSNGALPVFYSPGDNTRRSLLANKTFYDSFGSNADYRRGALNTGLFSTQALTPDTPLGYWINKYPRLTSNGNFVRNIKIFRYSEAFLNRIEALRLTGQEAQALTELNAFAASRKGVTYTGADLLRDILTERSKEFYGEGQRFLDLKRYNLPVNRPSNCTTCELPADDKRFVLPLGQNAINQNSNLKQYPGY